MEYRKALHKALALDLTKPYFRRGNAIKFDIQANEILVNPHQALLHKGICLGICIKHSKFITTLKLLYYLLGVTGKLSIVDGLYSYHHYMQDNFDDNGWGCAYRSLQTIISWFRYKISNEITIHFSKVTKLSRSKFFCY